MKDIQFGTTLLILFQFVITVILLSRIGGFAKETYRNQERWARWLKDEFRREIDSIDKERFR